MTLKAMPMKNSSNAALRAVAYLALLLASMGASAQTFKMPCEVEGVIPALEDRKIPAEKVELEILTLGKNLFFRVNGSKMYQMQTSSLTTEDFDGKNLTTEKEMGASRKHKSTGFESEVRVTRSTVTLHAFNDMTLQGKRVRVNFEGPCTLPH
jgi:hypothetical protein